MNNFELFHANFSKNCLHLNPNFKKLKNGAIRAIIGNEKFPKIAIMSGLHGDERSGPSAISSWLKEISIIKKTCLWVCPLLNNFGWNNFKRKWCNKDLNCSFCKEKAPEFLLQTMRDLKKFKPQIFIDLHEDSLFSKPYYFRCEGDNYKSFFKMFDCDEELWKSESSDWNNSSETFVRENLPSCQFVTTLEVPTRWSLQKKIDWWHNRLDKVLRFAEKIVI